MSVLRAARVSDDPFFDEIEELGVFAFGIDRRAATLVFDERGNALQPLLLVARQQILDLAGMLDRPVQRARANFRPARLGVFTLQ